MPKPALKFQSHSPERRRRAASPIACGCSCCCCCIHTLGGLIGAALAKTTDAVEFKAKSAYWRALGVVTLLAVTAGVVYTSEPIGPLVVILLVMPGLQILASVIVMLWFTNPTGNKEDDNRARAIVARITLRTVAGASIGVGVMLAIAFVLSYF